MSSKFDTVFDAVKFINEQPSSKWEKDDFSPSEQLALIAIRPFLEVIGGRIAMMLDMAIERGKTK